MSRNSDFQTTISQECYAIFLLINVKMPTIVGILTFMSRKKIILKSIEHEKSFITSGPDCVSLVPDHCYFYFVLHIIKTKLLHFL